MSKKTNQTNQLIQSLLAPIITREIELPAGVLVTINRIETSDDQKYAKVWLVISPAEQVGKAYGLVRKNLKHLQHELAEQLNMRVSPKLQLRLDKSASHVMEIESILAEIKGENNQ